MSAHVERRRSALANLQEQLQSVPTFISDLDAITASIGGSAAHGPDVELRPGRPNAHQTCVCVCVCSAQLEGDFEELESRLVYLEALCCQCEELTSKQHHISSLEAHQRKKRFARRLPGGVWAVVATRTNVRFVFTGAAPGERWRCWKVSLSVRLSPGALSPLWLSSRFRSGAEVSLRSEGG